MNWYPTLSTDIATTDDYINKSIYGGVINQGEGIDLRQEMRWILYGKNTFPARNPKGHWIVYRRYDLSKKSSYYSERTHEGVGGPTYEYADELLRTRRIPVNKRNDSLQALKVGLDISDAYNYYFEYTVVPKMGDHIFEINWNDHAKTPTLAVPLIDRYLIKKVHPYRLDNGNIQYYIISCDYDEVSY